MVSRPREPDQRPRFGKNQVSQRGETGGHSPHGGIREYRDEQPPLFVVSGQGRGDLGHLHQGQNPFVHAGPSPRTTNHDQWQVQVAGDVP